MHATTANTNTISHITEAVYRHGFCDPSDWAIGLDELADLSEEQIDVLISDSDCELLDLSDRDVETLARSAHSAAASQPIVPRPTLRPLSDPDDRLSWSEHATYVLLLIKGLSRIDALSEVLSAGKVAD